MGNWVTKFKLGKDFKFIETANLNQQIDLDNYGKNLGRDNNILIFLKWFNIPIKGKNIGYDLYFDRVSPSIIIPRCRVYQYRKLNLLSSSLFLNLTTYHINNWFLKKPNLTVNNSVNIDSIKNTQLLRFKCKGSVSLNKIKNTDSNIGNEDRGTIYSKDSSHYLRCYINGETHSITLPNAITILNSKVPNCVNPNYLQSRDFSEYRYEWGYYSKKYLSGITMELNSGKRDFGWGTGSFLQSAFIYYLEFEVIETINIDGEVSILTYE